VCRITGKGGGREESMKEEGSFSDGEKPAMMIGQE
jgi:hypothetical protein